MLTLPTALPIFIRRTMLTRLALQVYPTDPERTDMAKLPMPQL